MNPPEEFIHEATLVANYSGCKKSKRGVVIFDEDGYTHGSGTNGPPVFDQVSTDEQPFQCSGSKQCRASCAQTAVHAEVRALRDVKRNDEVGLPKLQLLHVKTVDGELVAGCGPSCVLCSKEILDSGIVKWVWLFEKAFDPDSCDMKSRDSRSCEIERHGVIGKWKRYHVVEFHELSLKARSMFEDV